MGENSLYVIKLENSQLPLAEPYVGEDGIYGVSDIDPHYHKLIMTKEQFIEAYNKWIDTPND